jgi:hypothetical protein
MTSRTSSVTFAGTYRNPQHRNASMGNYRCKSPGRLSVAATCCLIAAVVGVPARTLRSADAATLEKQVKSAFVVNFIQFVDWPATAFEKPDDPIIIGVADANSLGDALAGAIDGKSIRGRKLGIKTGTAATASHCHVLIAGGIEGADLQTLLKGVGATACLTIGDAEHFTEAGGTIRFYVEDRKERFEINVAAANRANLQVSSKLLKLAKVVNP